SVIYSISSTEVKASALADPSKTLSQLVILKPSEQNVRPFPILYAGRPVPIAVPVLRRVTAMPRSVTKGSGGTTKVGGPRQAPRVVRKPLRTPILPPPKRKLVVIPRAKLPRPTVVAKHPAPRPTSRGGY